MNAALAAAVAALFAFVYFKPSGNAPAEYPLTALKASEVKSLRIERPGTPDVVLEKKQDLWFVTAPLAARGDDFRVQQLTGIVEAKATHRLAAADLARFELEPPQARVTIDGRIFGFGMVNPMTQEQYVLAGDAVHTVAPRYGAALPANAAELASRQLLAPDETPVGITLKDFSVEQRAGRWVLAPAAGELSHDDLIRWVEEWRHASAVRVEPYVKGKAPAEIKIQLKGRDVLTLGLLAREPELVVARPDEKLQYYFSAETAKRLLSPPGTAARSEPAGKK